MRCRAGWLQNSCSLDPRLFIRKEYAVGIRYLGSKARVLEALTPLIGEPPGAGRRFVDAFAGTGTVASAAADLGWNIHINDHLRCATLLSGARMLAKDDINYTNLGGYLEAIELLNAVQPVEGFIWREYSPASAKHAPRPRLYFTEENAGRIDGIRTRIRQWRTARAISKQEETLLLADLIESASSVSNTAGTFGCFLSKWSQQSLRPLKLRQRSLRKRPVRFTVSEDDVFSIQTRPGDTVYLDPPYTKRQYAAYYHLLETLAHGDEPTVSGITGLRPWQGKASVFSYKRHALSAMLRLTKSIRAARVLISYSNDGHIGLSDLADGLRLKGNVKVHRLCNIPRYQPNGSELASVDEFVIEYLPGTP